MRRAVVVGVLSRGGLAAVRELGQAGWSVVGVDWRRAPFGLHSRWSGPTVRVPPPGDPAHGDALLELCARERADVILPLATPTVATLARMRARFGRVAVAGPPADAYAAASDKRRTMEDCSRLGIPVPHARPGGPWVVKPARDVGAARGVAICATPGERAAAEAACRARWGAPVVQDHVPGGPGAVRTTVLLFDRASRLVAHFGLRKVRTYPASGGLTALAVSVHEPALLEQALPLFRRWSWQGPAEVEWKVDARDGVAKVLEINPRFPGYVDFASRCGPPLALLAVRAALGEAPPAPASFAVGVRYLNPGLWLRSVAAEVAAGPSRIAVLRRAGAELREGVGPARVRSPADPLPVLGKVLLECRRALLRG